MKKLKLIYPKLINDKLELYIGLSNGNFCFYTVPPEVFWNSVLLGELLNCTKNLALQLFMLHHSDASFSSMQKVSMKHIVAEITLVNY